MMELFIVESEKEEKWGNFLSWNPKRKKNDGVFYRDFRKGRKMTEFFIVISEKGIKMTACKAILKYFIPSWMTLNALTPSNQPFKPLLSPPPSGPPRITPIILYKSLCGMMRLSVGWGGSSLILKIPLPPRHAASRLSCVASGTLWGRPWLRRC